LNKWHSNKDCNASHHPLKLVQEKKAVAAAVVCENELEGGGSEWMDEGEYAGYDDYESSAKAEPTELSKLTELVKGLVYTVASLEQRVGGSGGYEADLTKRPIRARRGMCTACSMHTEDRPCYAQNPDQAPPGWGMFEDVPKYVMDLYVASCKRLGIKPVIKQRYRPNVTAGVG
jgi:hypothetical protein